MNLVMEKRDVIEEMDMCEHCGGTGEVSVIESVYPGEAHMADVGTRKCECRMIDEDFSPEDY